MTVQVKTASAPSGQVYRFYSGNIGQNTDLIALVALQLEVVLIYPTNRMLQRFPVDQFTREEMAASIREHLA